MKHHIIEIQEPKVQQQQQNPKKGELIQIDVSDFVSKKVEDKPKKIEDKPSKVEEK